VWGWVGGGGGGEGGGGGRGGGGCQWGWGGITSLAKKAESGLKVSSGIESLLVVSEGGLKRALLLHSGRPSGEPWVLRGHGGGGGGGTAENLLKPTFMGGEKLHWELGGEYSLENEGKKKLARGGKLSLCFPGFLRS